MTTWLILDETQTVINVVSDLGGKAPLVIDPGQTAVDIKKAPQAGLGFQLTADGEWFSSETLPPDPVKQIRAQIDALPADKKTELLNEMQSASATPARA